jgi:peptide/nickel transport system permease protein
MSRIRWPRGLAPMVGLAIIVINVAGATLAPWIAPYGEADLIGDVWAPPGAGAWLGLDNLGRDMLSRILYGAQTTIAIAFASTFLAFLLGVTSGFTAALAGRRIDALLSRLVDTLMAIPTLILALVVISVMGSSIPVLVLTVGVIGATRVFRISRAVAFNISALDYVAVARLRGETLMWLLGREILPNASGPLATEFGLRFCFAILFIAALSFLGLGIQPPRADWGSMVRDNAQAILAGGIAPLVPAAAIAILAIGVNLVVDAYVSARDRTRSAGA